MTNYYETYLQNMNGKQTKRLSSILRFVKRDNAVALQLHSTDILTFTSDGKVVLNSGEWWTKTTKKHMNAYLPPFIGIYQKKFEWFIEFQDGSEKKTLPFQDGMTFDISNFAKEGVKLVA